MLAEAKSILSPDVQMSPEEDTLAPSDDGPVELEDSDSDVAIVEDASRAAADLNLSASDSDVRLAFDDSLFDSDPDLAGVNSDVQLADDSAADLEDSAVEPDAAGILDFDGPSDDGDSDSDVSLISDDSDSDVTMVGAGTDPDIELIDSATNLSGDSSVVFTGSRDR